MKHMFRSWSPGTIVPPALMASAIVGLLAVMTGIMITHQPETDMYLSPTSTTLVEGEVVTVDLVVTSRTPVNVFAGEVRFDPTRLQIQSIDYNTSIADLWAEKPWYENGAGTLAFGGGTTATGGFSGNGTLMTVTFEAIGAGEAMVSVFDPRILLHDGLGTDSEVRPSIDTIITIREENRIVQTGTNTAIPFVIFREKPNTDINGDGRQTLGDVSVLMLYLAQGDLRGDVNGDGKVTMVDLSLLLSTE